MQASSSCLPTSKTKKRPLDGVGQGLRSACRLTRDQAGRLHLQAAMQPTRYGLGMRGTFAQLVHDQSGGDARKGPES